MLLPFLGRVCGGGGLSSTITNFAIGSGLLTLWSAPVNPSNDSVTVRSQALNTFVYTIPLSIIILQTAIASNQLQGVYQAATKTRPLMAQFTTTHIGQKHAGDSIFALMTVCSLVGISCAGSLTLNHSVRTEQSSGDSQGEHREDKEGHSREQEISENPGELSNYFF